MKLNKSKASKAACFIWCFLIFGSSESSLLIAQVTLHDRGLFSVIVLPDKEEESLLTIDEYLTAADAVGSALSDKGFRVMEPKNLNRISDLKRQLDDENATNHFKILTENAISDITVTVDLSVNIFKNDKSVSVLLSAKDSYTAERLVSTGWMHSSRRRWPDLRFPVSEALRLNGRLDSFALRLESKMHGLLNSGRFLDFQVESRNAAVFPIDTFVSSKDCPLNLCIIEWIKQRTVNKSIHSVAGNHFLFRVEGAMPIFDENGFAKSPLEWGNELQQYIKTTLAEMKISDRRVRVNVIGGLVLVLIE